MRSPSAEWSAIGQAPTCRSRRARNATVGVYAPMLPTTAVPMPAWCCPGDAAGSEPLSGAGAVPRAAPPVVPVVPGVGDHEASASPR